MDKTKPKEKLEQLEKENKWVFHGSRKKLEKLTPHQAFKHSPKRKIPDGEPMVFASPFIDIAIFMAIMNKKNLPGGFESGYSFSTGEKIKFNAKIKTTTNLDVKKGYVYVLDKKKFTPRSFAEYLSKEEIIPNDVIAVSGKDLPEDIKIEYF